MFDSIRLILTEFNDEALIVLGLFLLAISVLWFFSWMGTRKRFHQLKHQIPAGVVKNYLDSIIHNSNTIKSSLFRGGGGELSAAPAPAQSSGGGASSAELHQKIAEISSLNALLREKEGIITDLEAQVETLKNSATGDNTAILDENSNLKKEVEKLQEELKNVPSGEGGGDTSELTKELNEVKEKLHEYEVIEDDLANLKKLQKENTALKEEITKLKGGEPPEPPPADEEPEEEEEEKKEEPADDKSAEDLLSEFEKMLG